jgi:hypothetical protein
MRQKEKVDLILYIHGTADNGCANRLRSPSKPCCFVDFRPEKVILKSHPYGGLPRSWAIRLTAYFAETKNVAYIGVWISETHPVKHIEKLKANFERNPLANRSTLHEPNILIVGREIPDIQDGWCVPNLEWPWNLKGVDVQVHVLGWVEVAELSFLRHPRYNVR